MDGKVRVVRGSSAFTKAYCQLFCTLLSLFRIIHVEKGGLQKRDELNVKIRGSGCLTGSLVTICLYNIRIEFLNYISLKKLYRKSYTFDQMFKDKM